MHVGMVHTILEVVRKDLYILFLLCFLQLEDNNVLTNTYRHTCALSVINKHDEDSYRKA